MLRESRAKTNIFYENREKRENAELPMDVCASWVSDIWQTNNRSRIIPRMDKVYAWATHEDAARSEGA